MSERRDVRSADGTRIAVEVSGSGPAIVVVNGALSDRRTTDRVRPFLEPHFTVVGYDRRGRGDSGDEAVARGDRSYRSEREVEDLAAVVASVQAPVLLFGHSGGALVAIEAAIAGLPIDRLAVNEPPYVVDETRARHRPDLLARLIALIEAGDREGALRAFLREGVAMPEADVAALATSPVWPRWLDLAPSALWDVAVVGDGEVPVARLARIRVPALVLRGGASFGWLDASTAAVAAALPFGRREVLPDQPHAPAPDVLAAALERFAGERPAG